MVGQPLKVQATSASVPDAQSNPMALAGGADAPGQPVVLGAVGAHVAVFALWRLARRGGGPSWLPRVLGGHALCSRAHLERGRVHTLVTSTWSHQGALHFAMNTYGLFVFGSVAAEVLSPRELGVLLASCGTGSSLCHVFCHPRTAVLGASGVLMGLVTADGLLDPERRWYMILPLPGLTLSMLQVADATLVANLTGFLLFRHRFGTVAWAAHLGGTAAGLGFACGAWWRGDPRYANPWRTHWERCAKDWGQTAESVEGAFETIATRLRRRQE